MTLAGYAGSMLFVDLSSGKFERQPLDARSAADFIGGLGIASKLVHDLIDPGVDALSPENKIIISTGPFNGTMIPGASKVIVTYRSPLNGAFPYSSGGGAFSHFLKSSGYDHLIISGQAPKPAYLVIGEDDARLIDATDLWGLDSFATTDELRKRHEPCSIIPIGPAGENRVLISVTQIDKGGTLGSGGLPAVMGAKKLKAIVALRGSQGIAVADRRQLTGLVDELLKQVKGYHRREEMMQGGMMSMTTGWVPEGSMVRGSTMLLPLPADAKWIQSQIYEVHKRSRKKIACVTCPMSDKDRLDLPDCNFTTYDTAISSERAMLTASRGFGGSDASSPQERYRQAISYYDLTNRYGVDRLYSFPGLVDFAVTLYQDGVITRKETGIELDRGLPTVLKLLRMTAYREGFGDVLADGITRAAQRIGRNAGDYVRSVVKGQFTIFDPRLMGLGTMQLAQLTHPGRPLAVGGSLGSPSYSPGWPIEKVLEEAERCGLPAEAQARIFSDKSFNVGRLTKHGEDFICLFNLLGLCHRLYISRFYSLDTIARLYSAVTGVEADNAGLKKTAGRVWDLWRLNNSRAGFTRKDDEPPAIWFQPLKAPNHEIGLTDYFKTKPLDKKDVQGFLDEYYDERGWDKETGIPAPKTEKTKDA